MEVLLQFTTPGLVKQGSKRFEVPDYWAWCVQFEEILRKALRGTEAYTVQGVVAEPRMKPASRVRRYKGFRSLYLANSALLDDSVLVQDGAYASGNREFLYTLLQARGGGVANVFRLCLDWPSANLLLSASPITQDTLEQAFGGALQLRQQGPTDEIWWDRHALLEALPEAHAVAGVASLTLGSTWQYDLACKRNLFQETIRVLAQLPSLDG